MRTSLTFLISIVLLSQVMVAVVPGSCWMKSIGRGVGKVIHACPEGLQNEASLCYVPCREGYTGVGPLCWLKGKAYSRGVGVPLGCSPTEEENASLCYKKCDSGFAGVGPVCWAQCPGSYHACGVLCIPGGAKCTDLILGTVQDSVDSVALVAAKAIDGEAVTWESMLQHFGRVADDFIYGFCPTPSMSRLLLDA